MSLIELLIIVLLALGVLDISKVKKIMSLITSSNFSQKREIIGDKTLKEKWVWIEEE